MLIFLLALQPATPLGTLQSLDREAIYEPAQNGKLLGGPWFCSWGVRYLISKTGAETPPRLCHEVARRKESTWNPSMAPILLSSF